MDFDFEHMSYKYIKAILSFVFIMAIVVTFTRGCINNNIAKEKRATIPIEIDSKDDIEQDSEQYRENPDDEEQPVREYKTSEQKEFLQAQERIKKVQKQLAEEEGYSARRSAPARYIQNNESFETVQEEPRAQVLDEAPSSIIIEPAD